jgi:hypothetical protein
LDRGTSTVRRERTAPDAIRSVSGFERFDYVDVFTVSSRAAGDRTPEEWARAGIEAATRIGGQFVWRTLLGLRLERESSPDHVGGWTIADRGDEWIRLAASSWFMTAHLVFRIDDGQASIATIIRYDLPIAPLIWLPVAVAHRRALPRLLHHAEKAVRRTNTSEREGVVA